MSLSQQVLRGLSWTAGAKLAGQLFTWSATIVTMRVLVPEDYGLMAMAMIFIAFCFLFDEVGLAPALVQAQDLSDLQLRQVFGMILMANAVFFLALLLAAPLIGGFFGEPRLAPIISALAFQFLIGATGKVPEALMQRELQFKQRALVELAAGVGASLVTLGLALSGHGVWALVLGSLSGTAFRAAGYNLVRPYLALPQFAWNASRGIVHFGLSTMLARLAWYFYSQADMFIAGKMLGKQALGYYSVALHLASLPVNRIAEAVFQVTFPMFARIQGDRPRVRASVLQGVRLMSLVLFPVLFGISAAAPELVLVLLGSKWEGAILPMQLLALMMPLRAISTFLFAVTNGIGRPDLALLCNVRLLVVMPLALIAAAHWGVTGLCVAWLTAYPAAFVVNGWRLLPAMNTSLPECLSAMARPVGAALAMYLAVAGVRALWIWDERLIERLLVLVATGALAYCVASLAFNRPGCAEAWQLIRNRRSA